MANDLQERLETLERRFLQLERLKDYLVSRDIDLPDDDILEDEMLRAEETILRLRRSDHLAKQYYGLQIDMTISALAKRGAEGQLHHNELGVVRVYDTAGNYPQALLKQITTMLRPLEEGFDVQMLERNMRPLWVSKRIWEESTYSIIPSPTEDGEEPNIEEPGDVPVIFLPPEKRKLMLIAASSDTEIEAYGVEFLETLVGIVTMKDAALYTKGDRIYLIDPGIDWENTASLADYELTAKQMSLTSVKLTFSKLAGGGLGA